MSAVAFAVALATFANLSPDAALSAAIANSPDVVAADARVAENAGLLDEQRGTLAPSLTSNYTQVPQGNPPGPNVIARVVSVALEANVTQFISFGARVRQSALLLVAANADAASARRVEKIRVIGLYYDALAARETVATRQRSLALARATLDAAQKRFAVGDVARVDVLRAEVGVARSTADLETARGIDENAVEALRIETGTAADLSATTEAQPAATADAGVVTPHPSASAAASLALVARAEVGSALAAQRAAEASRAIAATSGFPLLTVSGGYTAGTDSGVPIGAPSLSAAMNFPLGGGERARVRTEDARLAQARANVARVKRTVTLEVGAAVRTLDAAERSAVATGEAARAAQTELDASELGYRAGAVSSLDVETARESYVRAVLDDLTARYTILKDRRTLEFESAQ